MINCYVLSDANSDAVLNKEKALVVYSGYTDEKASADTIWKNINKKDEFIPTPGCFYGKGLWANILYVYTVPPGEYTLVKIISKK